jgi:hypothetical protein
MTDEVHDLLTTPEIVRRYAKLLANHGIALAEERKMPEEFIAPEQLASDLQKVYQDEEASTFERNLAAVGLTVFWLGVEVDRLTTLLEVQYDQDSRVAPADLVQPDEGRG